jgi:hypothetical protein
MLLVTTTIGGGARQGRRSKRPAVRSRPLVQSNATHPVVVVVAMIMANEVVIVDADVHGLSVPGYVRQGAEAVGIRRASTAGLNAAVCVEVAGAAWPICALRGAVSARTGGNGALFNGGVRATVRFCMRVARAFDGPRRAHHHGHPSRCAVPNAGTVRPSGFASMVISSARPAPSNPWPLPMHISVEVTPPGDGSPMTGVNQALALDLTRGTIFPSCLTSTKKRHAASKPSVTGPRSDGVARSTQPAGRVERDVDMAARPGASARVVTSVTTVFRCPPPPVRFSIRPSVPVAGASLPHCATMRKHAVGGSIVWREQATASIP